MIAMLKFAFRLVLRHWFPLLLTGIAFYVVFQKELRIVLYFQKPTEQAPLKEVKSTEVYAENPLKGESKKENRLNLLSWGQSSAPQQMAQPGLQEALQKISRERQLQYLKRFARVAVAERKKFGLPSSIILAMALLHSTAGEAPPARQANNHFGLLCSDFWNGSQKEIAGQCYRAYENAWSSFRDFSLFASRITCGKTTIPPTDHQQWAKCLERENISPVPQLSKALEQIIKEFQLYELDFK